VSTARARPTISLWAPSIDLVGEPGGPGRPPLGNATPGEAYADGGRRGAGQPPMSANREARHPQTAWAARAFRRASASRDSMKPRACFASFTLSASPQGFRQIAQVIDRSLSTTSDENDSKVR